METVMKTDVLVKKLKARQATLKANRVKALASYDVLFEKWKRDVAKWVTTTVPERVKDVKKGDLDDRGHYGSRCCSGLPSHVFRGIPEPPKKPTDDAIKSIQKTLRFIAITDQKTMQVDDRDLKQWGFSGAEDDE
ncbi:MAG TPA: hypothetical protein VFN70_18030 [Burkholderiales bacterium]|nr:hypothetical protein [Burkholderiales bacterium]